MSLRDPFTVPTPSQVRPVGKAPYWTPGQTVTWTFRRFDFDRDLAEVARPMRVIADGPEGSVLWLAGGTPTQETRIVGWEDTNAHDVPLKARFRPLSEAPTRTAREVADEFLAELGELPDDGYGRRYEPPVDVRVASSSTAAV